MLVRAWLFLGLIVAALSMGGFFYVLTGAGWHWGDPVGPASPFHHAYQQATTMTFLGMIFGQIGTAFAVRTQRESLWSVGVFSNRYLLLAIAAELALAAVFVYAPPLQALLGTAALPGSDLVLLLPYPFIVWGADELRRFIMRRRTAAGSADRDSTTAARLPEQALACFSRKPSADSPHGPQQSVASRDESDRDGGRERQR
jgi:magnesium-transporting ATPase (P-type)